MPPPSLCLSYVLSPRYAALCQLDGAYESMTEELQKDLERLMTRAVVDMERVRLDALGKSEGMLEGVRHMADLIDSSGEVRGGGVGRVLAQS